MIAGARFASVLLSIVPSVVHAGANDPWQLLPAPGPGGDRAAVEALADSPIVRERMLAWTGGVFYRTTNGGTSWDLVPGRLVGKPPPPALTGLQFDPVDPDAAWAGGWNLIFRTTDFGETWRAWGQAVPGTRVEDLRPDRTDPAGMWVGTSGDDSGAWRTTDGGSTWSAAGLAGVDVLSIAPRPGDAGTVLAGTPHGIARTTDSGDTWTWVRAGQTALHLEWDETGVVVRAAHDRLIESTDAGTTWRSYSRIIRPEIESYAFDPAHPARLLFASVDYCQVDQTYGYSGNAECTTDAGFSWRKVAGTDCATFEWPLDFHGAGVHCTETRAWAWWPNLGADLDTFQRSTDGGSTWAPGATGMQALTLSGFAVDGSGHLYARSWHGYWRQEVLYRSTDGGIHWESLAMPNGEFGRCRGLLASRTRAGQLLEVGDRVDICTWIEYAGLSSDGGETWDYNCNAPPGPPQCAALGHGTGQHIYIWGLYGFCPEDPIRGSRSDDGGRTYVNLGFLPFVPGVAVITPENGHEVFATTTDASPVMRTTDGGQTWHGRSEGLPGGTPVALLMDPTRGDHLLVVFETGIPWESTDRGQSWSRMAREPGPARSGRDGIRLPPDLELHRARVVDADWDVHDGRRRVFLSTDRGVWVSDLGFVGTRTPQVAFDWIRYSRATERLVVASKRHGIFALDLAPIGVGPPTDAPRGTPPASAPLSLAPNPFAGSSSIRFGLGRAGSARLEVFDPAGRRVATLVDGRLAAGGHAYSWSGRNDAGRAVAPGVYFVRLTTPERRDTRRIVRLR